MMKIVIAPDKFKGTLTAWEATEIISQAVVDSLKDVEVVKCPMADGGDGTLSLFLGYGAVKKNCKTKDALHRDIVGEYAVLNDTTAIVEMSQSVGLARIIPNERDIEKASSFGFGMTIKNAIDHGFRDFLLCIGGSATNDCGTGMLSALGAIFFDDQGRVIEPCGKSMIDIERMDTTKLYRNISGCSFKVACDVINPLYGESGAARVYAPQKGADIDCVERLEQGGIHFSRVAQKHLGMDISHAAGTGAAGGVGAALYGFLGAEIVSGAELICNYVGLAESLDTADLLITAEGKIDDQTFSGKLIGILYQKAQAHSCKIIAYCGTKELATEAPFAVFPLVEGIITQQEAINNSKTLLYEKVKNTIKNI